MKRACVIGAGAAGLCALKYIRENGIEAVAYEKCNEIGGTWVYTDGEKGISDEEVHSSMYEGLRTNLPKEVMNFKDFEYPADMQQSYILASEVLEYFQAYAKHFELGPHIKLQHEVIRVRPHNEGWEVILHDLCEDQYRKEFFDFVFVCNGRYATPSYPNVEGLPLYEGKIMHSHVFRKAEVFQDSTLLIVGAGRSGMDITSHLYPYAKQIYLSHHVAKPPRTDFMPNVIQKPDVQRFTKTGAIFNDGSSADFSHIIFCTGYRFTVPFLSADCGIHVDDNFVYPLYKHCININYPTMCFIGLPIYAYPVLLFDMQMRFVMKYYSGELPLPGPEEMLADTERDLEDRRKRGVWSKRRAHIVGERQFDYYNELVALTGIENVRPVIRKLAKSCANKFLYELNTYRHIGFRIIDDDNFEQFQLKSN